MSLQKKKLLMLAGLGNPGSKYEGTPHNVGLAALLKLADSRNVSMRRSFRFKARTGRLDLEDGELLLVEPLTYMNNSGIVVAELMRYRQIASEDLVVISDDADLKIGRIRIRASGSSGGHKGLESIIQCIGSDKFARVRIGIGRGRDSGGLVEHVLKPFSSSERTLVSEMVTIAVEAAEHLIAVGVDSAMNRFNGIDRSSVEAAG